MKKTAYAKQGANRGNPPASRSNARKDTMRALASQAAANAPGIDQRIATAQNLIANHPLRSEQAYVEPVTPAMEDQVPPTQSAVQGPTAEPSGAATIFHIANPRGKFELVPLDQIVPNPFNARKAYRDVRIKEMRASIAANGQETPGTATIRDGKFVLAAGHYRFKALQLLDAPYMGLMVIPDLTDKALYEISYRENAERDEQTAFDNALAWRELLDSGIYGSEQELAEAVGMSGPNVNKTLGILRISQPVLDLVAEEPARFALSVLYELALFEPVGGTDRAVALAKSAAAGEIGRQQINDARAQLQSAKPRKGRESARHYKIQVAGSTEGVLKEWPSGKVAFEVNIDDPDAREKFVNELRAQFGLKD
jgi:ParB family chromosome partitioning protein